MSSPINSMIKDFIQVDECFEVEFFYTEISFDIEEYETYLNQIKEKVVLNFKQFESNVRTYNKTIETKKEMKEYFNKVINKSMYRIDVRALNKHIGYIENIGDDDDIKIVVKNDEYEPDEYTEDTDIINIAYILNVKKID